MPQAAEIWWLLHESLSHVSAENQQWAEQHIPTGFFPAGPSTPGSLGPKWEHWRYSFCPSCVTILPPDQFPHLQHCGDTFWLFHLGVYEVFLGGGKGDGEGQTSKSQSAKKKM